MTQTTADRKIATTEPDQIGEELTRSALDRIKLYLRFCAPEQVQDLCSVLNNPATLLESLDSLESIELAAIKAITLANPERLESRLRARIGISDARLIEVMVRKARQHSSTERYTALLTAITNDVSDDELRAELAKRFAAVLKSAVSQRFNPACWRYTDVIHDLLDAAMESRSTV